MDRWTKADGVENHPAVTMRGSKAIVGHCYRCVGRGYIEAFRHVANGICFRCGGRGEVPFDGSNIIERTVAYCEKIGADNETFNKLFAQANTRFYKWLGDKMEREATEMAREIWNAGGHVDRETKYDSQFTWLVRVKVEALYKTQGRSPVAIARETARIEGLRNGTIKPGTRASGMLPID